MLSAVLFLAEKSYYKDGFRLHPTLTLTRFISQVQKEGAIILILLRKLVCPENALHASWLCPPLSLEVNHTATTTLSKKPPLIKVSSTTPLQ